MTHTLQGRIVRRYRRGDCYHDSRAGVICGIGKDWVDVITINLGENHAEVVADYTATLQRHRRVGGRKRVDFPSED
jgi:hypothetical protein